MRHMGNRNGVIQPTSEERAVTDTSTVTDGDFVEMASGRVARTDGSGKLYGVVLGGSNDDLVSRNYRAPNTVGDSTGTKKVLVELCEGQMYQVPVNGTLASDAEGSYYNLLPGAQSLLTSDATAPSDGDTVTVGSTTYTFKTTLTTSPSTVANEVLINSTAAAALDNLKAAVNLTGTIGTDYGTGTVINPDVTATTNTNTTQLFEAKSATVSGRAIVSTETSAHLSFDNATLLGGAGDPHVNNLSKSSTVGQLLCVKRVADANGNYTIGNFVVAAPQSATTPS